MTRMFSFKAALAASVCLLPLQAIAQSTGDSGNTGASAAPTIVMPPSNNWILGGMQYNSGATPYLNRFTGATSPGFYGLGGFNYGHRDAWDSGGTNYWQVQGSDLGLDSRSFSIEAGQQGTWGLGFSYDGIPHQGPTDFKSVWTSSGALVPGVAPGSLPLVFPATPVQSGVGKVNSVWLPTPSSTLGAQMYDYSIGTQRDVFTGTGKYEWGPWTITGAIRHEHKTGYQANSFEIGGPAGVTFLGSGGAANTPPTAVTSALGYFAMPIDYVTDRYDVTAAYSTRKLQVQFGYTFSNFKDDLTQFDAINPFGFHPTTSFGTAAANLSVPYSMPPSNSAHEFKFMLGYNLSPTTRLNANFAYGLQMQDAAYATGTGDPVAVLSEPASSLNGFVQTFFGNIAISSQPLPKLDLRLAYTIDDYDNQTPRNGYQVNTRSSTSLSGGGDCAFTGGLCYNLPFSFEHQTLEGEVGYRVLPQTKVSLTDKFESTYRTYADVSLVTSNTVTAKVRSELASDLFGTVSYSHQDRVAHNYANGNTWALLSGGGVNADPSGFLMFFEASRRHDEVKGSLDFSPIHTVSAELVVKFANDRYPDGQYGLRNNSNLEIGPDVDWQVTPALNAHAYYTYQQIYYEQSSLYSSGTNYTSTGTGYFVPWTAKTTDSVHTVGLTVDWKAVPNKLKFSFDYNFSYGDTSYLLGDGMAVVGGAITSPVTIAALNFQPLPNVTSMLNMIQIRGEYTFRPNLTLVFGYAYERFDYNDFMNGTPATQYANVLMPGTLNPNEAVHVVGAGIRYRF